MLEHKGVDFRRVNFLAGSHRVLDPNALAGRGEGGRLGALLTRHAGTRRVVSRLVMAAFRVTKEQLRDDRERTGEILDRVDAWVEEGSARARLQPQRRSTRSSVSLRPSSVSASTRRRKLPRRRIC